VGDAEHRHVPSPSPLLVHGESSNGCSTAPGLSGLDHGLPAAWHARGRLDEDQYRQLCELRHQCSTFVSRRVGLEDEVSSSSSTTGNPGLVARLSEMRSRLEALVAEGSAALGHLEMQVAGGEAGGGKHLDV